MSLNIEVESLKLAVVDPDMQSLINNFGLPMQRQRQPGFATLINILISQQISLQAADAIWQKLNSVGTISPENIIYLGHQGLRDVGLSRSKSNWSIQLSEKFLNKEFIPTLLDEMDNETASRYIMQLNGFGEWSSAIYLMFCLGRTNIWPAGDIALQEAVRRLKKLSIRPNRKEMREISTLWTPHRTTAAHLLWHYYANAIRIQKAPTNIGFQ
ncbi:hypothetical protein N8156_03485 [Rhodospirillaceae bacterium]|nr:hypothetical protein [Rhodospirillaceae bacterium]